MFGMPVLKNTEAGFTPAPASRQFCTWLSSERYGSQEERMQKFFTVSNLQQDFFGSWMVRRTNLGIPRNECDTTMEVLASGAHAVDDFVVVIQQLATAAAPASATAATPVPPPPPKAAPVPPTPPKAAPVPPPPPEAAPAQPTSSGAHTVDDRVVVIPFVSVCDAQQVSMAMPNAPYIMNETISRQGRWRTNATKVAELEKSDQPTKVVATKALTPKYAVGGLQNIREWLRRAQSSWREVAPTWVLQDPKSSTSGTYFRKKFVCTRIRTTTCTSRKLQPGTSRSSRRSCRGTITNEPSRQCPERRSSMSTKISWGPGIEDFRRGPLLDLRGPSVH